MTQPFSLAVLIAEAERSVDERTTTYEWRVREKKMRQEEADRRIAAMEQIASVLQRLSDNLPMFRLLAKEKRIIQEHPEVQSVLAAFPGAEVTGVKEIEREGST